MLHNVVLLLIVHAGSGSEALLRILAFKHTINTDGSH